MKNLYILILTLAAFGASTVGHAQEEQEEKDAGMIFYAGIGLPSADENGDLDWSKGPYPWSAGAIMYSEEKLIIGADLGFEDTNINSEAQRYYISLNAIAGMNLLKTDSVRIDAGAMVGAIGWFGEPCHADPAKDGASYEAIQCFAEEAIKKTYSPNFGIILAAAVSNVTVGVRATPTSLQAIVGGKF